MKTFYRLCTVTIIAIAAMTFTGCGNSHPKDAETDHFKQLAFGNGNETTSSKTSPPSGKQKTPDEKELNEIVKKQLWKEFVSDSPFEIADVTANWVEKTAQSCSGDFSVNLRAKENLYDSINVKEGLEKLGIKNLYEGELKLAEEKVYQLPEPYKTNLRNEYPQDRLDSFHFVQIIRPQGSPDKAGGVAELSRYGDEWSASVRIKKTPSVERCIPESGLNNNVNKLDDPATKKAVEDVIQKRKDYVAKVDTTITELNDKFQAALEKQKQDFLTFCKPNGKYEGTWKYGEKGGKVVVQFGNYESSDQTIISGVYFNPDYPQHQRKFTVTLNTKEVAEYPVTGILTKPSKDFYNFVNGLRNDDALRSSMLALFEDSRDKIRIKISNGKLIVSVWASGWGSIQFDF
ncbi:MAG: hypothetical protein LBJ00_15220 [Planctomycetaceae bacterium]|jgi:hypothetical protein|nr:hypothetical protein [Planctomycetaceae bacterium]